MRITHTCFLGYNPEMLINKETKNNRKQLRKVVRSVGVRIHKKCTPVIHTTGEFLQPSNSSTETSYTQPETSGTPIETLHTHTLLKSARKCHTPTLEFHGPSPDGR